MVKYVRKQKNKLMKASQILTLLGLMALSFAMLMPWLAASFIQNNSIESFNLNLFDMYGKIFGYGGAKLTPYVSGLAELFSSIVSSLSGVGVIVISSFLFLITISFGVMSLFSRKFSLISSLLCFLTAILWIIGVDYLRGMIIQGTGTKSLALTPFPSDVASVISVGLGTFVVFFTGAIFLGSFLLEERAVQTQELSSELKAGLSEIEDQVRKVQEKSSRLDGTTSNLNGQFAKIFTDVKDLRREHDELVQALLRARVEKAYTTGDRIIANIRNTGYLPIKWLEVTDIDPRPKNISMPSDQIILPGVINPGEEMIFTYEPKDITGKPVTIQVQSTAKLAVGWEKVLEPYMATFTVIRSESQLQAEIEGARATGNSLIVNMKNTGTKKITRESIVSILPHPGGTVQTEQSVHIDPGETKTLIFTWIEGDFMIDTTYMAVMQVTDEINTVSLPFSVQTQ